MKKKILIAILTALCMFLGGCGNDAESMNESTENERGSAEEYIEPEYIDGFEKAEYEKFDSFASENGLGGTRIYVSGTVGKAFSYSNAAGICLAQEDGREWAINFWGEDDKKIEDELENIIGNKIEIFGEYIGYSDTMDMPVIKIYPKDDGYYAVLGGEIITQRAKRNTNRNFGKRVWRIEKPSRAISARIFEGIHKN